MLSLNSLGLSIEGKEFYKNISITLLPSAIIYLQGSNGSGKTSLLRMLAGLQLPNSGCITFGKNSHPISKLYKPYCTYIGHNLGIKEELTILEYLQFWAKAYDTEELIDATIMYFSLHGIENTKFYELSAGNRKKIALARLMICQSKLWLLDEIDSNLDRKNKELLTNLIVSHANNGGIVFITTHNKQEISTAHTIDLTDYR